MKKKKIIIIGYGGTIVMVVDPIKKAVVEAENVEQIMSLLPKFDEIADVTMEILNNKDSTNVEPADWSRLAMHIYEKHEDYDGFVITHGTNTMAYTASGLALALGKGLKKPVIITGSQLPLTVYGNDARFNFENAVKVAVEAAKQDIAEVMIVFSDVILRGCRSVKVSESSFHAFNSPAYPPIGSITSTGVHFNPTLVRKVDPNIPFELVPRFSTNIISMDLTPGQSPGLMEALVLSGKCHGVILKSHGAGSVPTQGDHNVLPFIKKTVHDFKIPVIVSTKFLGCNAYKEVNDECALEAINAGAIPGGDLTDVMTEVKLMWILAQGAFSEQEIRKKMLTDYVGEMTSIQDS